MKSDMLVFAGVPIRKQYGRSCWIIRLKVFVSESESIQVIACCIILRNSLTFSDCSIVRRQQYTFDFFSLFVMVGSFALFALHALSTCQAHSNFLGGCAPKTCFHDEKYYSASSIMKYLVNWSSNDLRNAFSTVPSSLLQPTGIPSPKSSNTLHHFRLKLCLNPQEEVILR